MVPRQQSALEAALLRGPRAIEAWERLKQQTNLLDETDIAVFRMLPMVYRNLRAEGLAEGDLGRLKGVYRQSWYRTRLALAPASRAVSTLQSAGLGPIALKGLGLIATVYPEPALRPRSPLLRRGRGRPQGRVSASAATRPSY